MVRTMGTIRPYKVVEDETVAQASYTLDIDLPNKGRFSYMNLLVKMITATTGVAPDPYLRNLITSISINQGGQAHLNAATPDMFQADAYYKTGKLGQYGYNVMGSEAGEILESIPIFFGESMHDPAFGIDLSKMSDPQLSITYNNANTGSGSDTLWETDHYPKFTPIIYLQEGVWPALQGYQSLRQIDKYTPADSEEHKTELQGLRPLKRIYAQLDLKSPAYGWIHSITRLKLIGDNEQWKPFEQDVDWWYQIIRDSYGLCNFKAYVYYAKGGETLDTGVDKRVYNNIVLPDNEDDLFVPYGGSGRNVAIKEITIADGSHPASINRAMYDFTGYTPWSIGVIDAAKMLGVEWLEYADKAPVYLQLDHVSNAATIGGPVRVAVADRATQI